MLIIRKELNEYDLQNEFKKYNRDNFSLEGCKEIIEFYNNYYDNGKEDIELDVIDIDCNFTESDPIAIINDLNLDSIEELFDNTYAVELNNSNILYHNY